MSWLVVGAAAALIAVVAYYVWRGWIAPWAKLEELVSQIARGDTPPTFLLTGASRPRNIGIALEDLLLHHRRLSQQISEHSLGNEAMLTAMEDGLLVVDTQHRVLVVNPAFEGLFSRPTIALPAPLLEVVRDAPLERLISGTFESGEPARGELSLSKGNSDSARQLQISAVPMKDELGNVRGAVVLFHDITELKLTDQIRRDFVANVSHELRTPLSIFRGYIETLLENPTKPSETRRILEVMEKHSNRLRLLVEDLLSLSKLESRHAVLEYSDVRFDTLLADAVRDWKKRFDEKKLTVTLETAPEASIIRADEVLLQEVVYNLLDNAVKYSREEGAIRLALHRAADQCSLSVIDSGIGIPKTDLPRIFERFYRADKARSRELGGTGLGLSIVKHIAQLHGGHVEAESEVGRGTTIRVTLPLNPATNSSVVTET